MYFPNTVTTDEIQDVLGAMTASAQAVAEFGLVMGSATIAEPLSGLAGIATGNIDNIAKVQDALTYQPRTRAGQVAMQSIAKDVANLADVTGLNELSGYWRDKVVPTLQENLGVISGSVLAAGGLGLITAMSEFVPGSRATRAMPFPQEGAIKRVFHGSADDIQGFDPSMRGSSTKARSAKEAFWFADNPDVAAGYAKRAAEDAPVQKLIDDSYAAERAGDFDKANDLMAEAERLELSGELVGGGGQNITPVDIDDADLLEIDMDGAFYDPDDTPLTDIIQQAKSEGKRGVKIKNFVDNADYGSDLAATHYGVFNPEDIKPAYRPKITAYHGTPHDFDKFSMDAIGTGEGAQAYGHGLYFAESEDVAKGYRDTLTKPTATIDGVSVSDYARDSHTPRNAAIDMVDGKGGVDNALSHSEVMLSDGVSPDYVNSVQKEIEKLRGKSISVDGEGSMYQVDIDASPDDFLDWDLPLSEQQGIVDKMRPQFSELSTRYTAIQDRLGELDNSGGLDSPEWESLVNESVSIRDDLGFSPTDSGSSFYGAIGSEVFDPTTMSSRNAAANAPLQQQGIKGIRYKDGFSRGDTGGTSNYVVFDENIISIAKKYGITPVAAASLLSMQPDDNTQ